MLTKEHTDLFFSIVEGAEQAMLGYKPSSQLYALESRYVLVCLKRHLLSDGDTQENLISFFRDRWETALKNTDIQYLHDFTQPANEACIKIAREIGVILNKPYLALLMPSLLDVPIDDYITSSYEEADLPLQELILNDENNRVIHLLDVLDGAQEDGILKQNSMIVGQAIPLSVSEQQRLLSRHPTVHASYDALIARREFKLNGDTAGAALMRLIEGLRWGGMRKLGKDFDSGSMANEAIFDFHAYLETLDEGIKQQLLMANKCDRYTKLMPESLSIGAMWKKLARPENVDYKSTTYCVELIANRLEEILKDNPWLYSLLSYWGEGANPLSELNSKVSTSKILISEALPLVKNHPFYGEKGEHQLLMPLLEKLIEAPEFFLEKNDIVYFVKKYASLINEPQAYKKVILLLRRVHDTHPQALITEVLNELNPFQQNLFRNATKFRLCFFNDRLPPDASLLMSKRKPEDDGRGEIGKKSH